MSNAFYISCTTGANTEPLWLIVDHVNLNRLENMSSIMSNLFLGEYQQDTRSHFTHVAALQLRSHEERCGPLHSPLQLQLCHLVVCGPECGHRHGGLPATLLPQEALQHQAHYRSTRETSLLSPWMVLVFSALMRPGWDEFHFNSVNQLQHRELNPIAPFRLCPF